CSNGRCVTFEVASQATVTTDPRECSFDDPPFRQHLKSSSVRSRLTICKLQAPVRLPLAAPGATTIPVHRTHFCRRRIRGTQDGDDGVAHWCLEVANRQAIGRCWI